MQVDLDCPLRCQGHSIKQIAFYISIFDGRAPGSSCSVRTDISSLIIEQLASRAPWISVSKSYTTRVLIEKSLLGLYPLSFPLTPHSEGFKQPRSGF